MRSGVWVITVPPAQRCPASVLPSIIAREARSVQSPCPPLPWDREAQRVPPAAARHLQAHRPQGAMLLRPQTEPRPTRSV